MARRIGGVGDMRVPSDEIKQKLEMLVFGLYLFFIFSLKMNCPNIWVLNLLCAQLRMQLLNQFLVPIILLRYFGIVSIFRLKFRKMNTYTLAFMRNFPVMVTKSNYIQSKEIKKKGTCWNIFDNLLNCLFCYLKWQKCLNFISYI